jgi:transposase
MPKTHAILLPDADRDALATLIAAGSAPARTLTHARVLLKADASPQGPAWTDARIAEALEVHERTVARVRQRWATGGLAEALHRRPTGPRPRKLDGRAEARLIAEACSDPPAGASRWTLRLLAAKLVELQIVDHIAPSTVRATLKKTR